MRAVSFYTVNVLTRWDAYLHALAHDVRFMSSDTLLHMRENHFAEAELIRRGDLSPQEEICGFEECEDETMDIDIYMDEDFVPFGEDDKLPKHLRIRPKYTPDYYHW